MSLGLTQQMSPSHMRGRLISLFTMISFGLQTIAVLIIGLIAEGLGIATAIQVSALLLISSAVAMLVWRTEFRRWVIALPQPTPAAAAEHP
jgi:hypothetical protein